MSQPILGAVTLPYPTNWFVTPIVGEVSSTSLSGKTRTDITYRKYKYTLQYSSVSRNEYELIVNAINDSLDNNTTPNFTYDKISSAQEVAVVPTMSEAERVSGAGGDYRVRLSIELLEVSSRI